MHHIMMNSDNIIPLAERMRPQSLDEFVGQKHIVGDDKFITLMLSRKQAVSMLFWGDPGTGKTTLAKIIAEELGLQAHFLSAISSGVADVRAVLQKGKQNRMEGKQTLLFIDEIHRFNKAQQDSILGAVEAGDVVLIGATTENPSFEVIAPLLSRLRILRLHPLHDDELETLLARAMSRDPIFSGRTIDDNARKLLIAAAQGDGRRLLNILESAAILAESVISEHIMREAVQRSVIRYDRAGDRHYDTISAFIKSLRGSDPDAALLYLARMIVAGEDPVFIARRMTIFASEDIGNAAPQALNLAVSALVAVQNIGMPEAEIILAHCATYLASAPKSNASYMAIKAAKEAVEHTPVEIPFHLRNAPTGLARKLGYGRDYRYPHEYPGHFIDEKYLPEEFSGKVFYRPTEEGAEKAIFERLRRLWKGRYDN